MQHCSASAWMYAKRPHAVRNVRDSFAICCVRRHSNTLARRSEKYTSWNTVQHGAAIGMRLSSFPQAILSG
jgi:hypothetical protein